ncbi:hypothetical protein L596_002020 [Steinernema carpocapsae]|uniref:SXP/RAL-2 family protein Ani s 5-like cation-binding domain-containing protein n=1 Tax=Steinernema carpocapsae TaxID=34508 RepID=A0A4V6I799_STECR|nr:hypothetical protein L596_002020 [Steinernema carpocapsae]
MTSSVALLFVIVCVGTIAASAGSEYMDGLISLVADNEAKAELTAAKNDITMPKRDRNVLILNVMMNQPSHVKDTFFLQLLSEQSKQAIKTQLASSQLKEVEPEVREAYLKIEDLKLDMSISDYQQEQEEKYVRNSLTKRQRQILDTMGTSDFEA